MVIQPYLQHVPVLRLNLILDYLVTDGDDISLPRKITDLCQFIDGAIPTENQIQQLVLDIELPGPVKTFSEVDWSAFARTLYNRSLSSVSRVHIIFRTFVEGDPEVWTDDDPIVEDLEGVARSRTARLKPETDRLALQIEAAGLRTLLDSRPGVVSIAADYRRTTKG